MHAQADMDDELVTHTLQQYVCASAACTLAFTPCA